METLRIGIDGGGTKTKCVIIDRNMNVISRSDGGATNVNSLGKEKVVETLKEIVEKCIINISSHESYDEKTTYTIISIGLGMSGCDRNEDQARLNDWVKSILENLPPESPKNVIVSPDLKIRVDNDAINVVSAGTLGAIEGIVLISGTGFICYGFAKDGSFRTRGGGWGPKLLDRGSGYYIGQQVLVKMAEMQDGMRKKTMMFDYVLKKLNLSTAQEIVPFVYHKCTEWSHVADLATTCFDLFYEHKDPTCEEIINDAINCLFEYVKLVATKIHEFSGKKMNNSLESIPKVILVLSGSILTHDDSVVNTRLRERVSKELSHLVDSITFPKVDLEIGAALTVK